MQSHGFQLEIKPYESVGSLRFGMTPANVHAQLAPHQAVRERSAPCDRFELLGIRAYYDALGHLEALELRAPCCPLLQGRPLIGQPYGPLEQWIATLDDNLKLEHSGLAAVGLGIRLYAASARRLPTTPIEVVTVFAHDYYQQYIASILPPPR